MKYSFTIIVAGLVLAILGLCGFFKTESRGPVELSNFNTASELWTAR